MIILGIETSCDETSAAVIEAKTQNQKVHILSNIVASSVMLHEKTGGIIPEIAAREQIKYIIPVINEALSMSLQTLSVSKGEAISTDPAQDSSTGLLHSFVARNDVPDIDAIAVTIGPGLIGSLLVGVETAKTLAMVWNKPIIPVNHLYGHIYANFISENLKSKIQHAKLDPKPYTLDASIEFPALALIVSGGHTDLVLIKNHTQIQWISGTRDDAAGEAFDKIGRLLGLPYPAGPTIEQLAKKGNPKAFHFPRPLLHEDTLDFSFSGLKTAALREVQKIEKNHYSSSDWKESRSVSVSNQILYDLSRATQDAIIDVLVKKTLSAAEKYNVKSILLSGGVAANQTLTNTFQQKIITQQLPYHFFVPPKSLCTDNAAMIASAAFYNYQEVPWQEVTANPELYFD